MRVFTQAFKPARHSTLGAINRAVNRDIEVGLGILDHDIRLVRQRHLYVAAFIAAARPAPACS